MKLGVSSYAYRWALGGDPRFGNDFKLRAPLDVFGLIEKVSALGLDVLQICENVDFDMAARDYERLGDVAKSERIALELGDAGIEPSVFRRNVHIAELTGSSLLRLYPVKREPIEKLAEKICGFLPMLGDLELTLAIENSSLCLYSSQQLAEVLEQIGDPLVGACVDTANSAGLLERPLETVRTLSPYVVSLHLKDFCIKRGSVGGFTILGVPLGKGLLDVKAVLNVIKESGRDPNIILEQWMDRSADEEETVKEEERRMKESIRFVRSLCLRRI